MATAREALDELICSLSKKKQEAIYTLVSKHLSATRIMLLEDLYAEGVITQKVGIAYMEREANYLSSINNE